MLNQEYCMFWTNWWWLCMTKAEWAGWVQAVGSIAAIMAGVAVVHWQLQRQQHQQRVDQTRKYRLIAGHIFAMRGALTRILDLPKEHWATPLKKFQAHSAELDTFHANDVPEYIISATIVQIRIRSIQVVAAVQNCCQETDDQTTFETIELMKSLEISLRFAEDEMGRALHSLGAFPPNQMFIRNGVFVYPEGFKRSCEWDRKDTAYYSGDEEFFYRAPPRHL